MYRDRKYQEARMLAMQARDLDPDNVSAQTFHQMVTMAENKDAFDSIEGKKQKFFIDSLNPNYDNMVDVKNPISLDKNILDKAANRKSKDLKGIYLNSHLSDIEKQIQKKLEYPMTPIKWNNTPLKHAIQDLKYLSGINVVPDMEALKDHSITLEAPITLDVDAIPLKSVLNLMLKQVGLTYVIKDNVLQITTTDHAKGNLVSVTYSVGDLVIPPLNPVVKPMETLENLLNKYDLNHFQYGPSTPLTSSYMAAPGQVVSPGNGPPGSNFAGGHPGQPYSGKAPSGVSGTGGWTLGTPMQTLEGQLIKLITSTIHPNTWTEVGGQGTIQYFPLGMGLIVNQTQDIQEQIVDLLDALRRLQELEVAIEIRLVAVSESFFEHIGLDFDINITTDQGRFEPQLITNTFQPFGFVNRFLPDGFVSGLTPAGTFTPDLNIPLRNSSNSFTLPPAGLGGFPGALGANGGLSLGLAFLSDIQVFMFLEAAQGDKRANAMQAPRVTVFNGQVATLSVTDQIPFLLNIAPNNPLNPQFFIPTQIGLPIGTTIFVNPVVTADRRFVRLGITQTMTNLISTNVPLIPIQMLVTDQVFGGQPNTGQPKVFQFFLQQPSTQSITVTTTVTVPDGGTVLLGGLKTLTEQRNEFGPPILSKIPYLNRLFRNVGYGREATSLLMMVTPRIIINEEEELIFLGKLEPIPRP